MSIAKSPPAGKNTHALHLYRAILRHGGVFYDDIARNYILRSARQQFEQARDVTNKANIRALHKEGRSAITLIQRANMGVEKAVNKVLRRVYGGSGRRRHELMKPVLEFPCEEPKPLVPGVMDTKPAKMPAPFVALLKWAGFTNIFPKYSGANRWGTGMTAARIKNVYKRNYKKLLKDCPTPLPAEEYEALARRANGDEVPVPPRRKIIPSTMASLEALGKRERPRDISDRGWRRLWISVLDTTPGMMIDPEKEKFTLLDYRRREVRTELTPKDFEGYQPQVRGPSKRGEDGRAVEPSSVYQKMPFDKYVARRGKWRS